MPKRPDWRDADLAAQPRPESAAARRRKRRIKVPDDRWTDVLDGRGGVERVALLVPTRRAAGAVLAAAVRLEQRAAALLSGERGRPPAWVARERARLLALARAVRARHAAAVAARGAEVGRLRREAEARGVTVRGGVGHGVRWRARG